MEALRGEMLILAAKIIELPKYKSLDIFLDIFP